MLGCDCLQLVCGSHTDHRPVKFWKDVSFLDKTKSIVYSSFFIRSPSLSCSRNEWQLSGKRDDRKYAHVKISTANYVFISDNGFIKGNSYFLKKCIQIVSMKWPVNIETYL